MTRSPAIFFGLVISSFAMFFKYVTVVISIQLLYLPLKY